MTANLYHVGDYVYFESASSTHPYHIRRIEELIKTLNGTVEAKVMSFFRRRDLPSSLLTVADKHQIALESDRENGQDRKCMTPKQKHQLKHRELFLSRQVEILPANLIRGKCSVTLLNETESLLSYLNHDDTFFYCLVFDPSERTLLSDTGEIRVGSKYQSDMPAYLKGGSEKEDPRIKQTLETLIWTPNNDLSDKQIDQFLITSRTLGIYARTLDCSTEQTNLVMNAAAASRDITLFNAMDTLHTNVYNVPKALSSLATSHGPVLCRDEMERWSASEANLFEEALERYGKDFNDIRQDYLPWKSLKSIIEYYYMWKTTDRYLKKKRLKAIEAETKLFQVRILNKKTDTPNSSVHSEERLNYINNLPGTKPCESCNAATSSQWYSWGPSRFQCKLCSECWWYWKKYGGLKVPLKLVDDEIIETNSISGSYHDQGVGTFNTTLLRPHKCCVSACQKEFKVKAQLACHYAVAHGLAVRAGSPGLDKVSTSFYLATTPFTKISRRLCKNVFKVRRAARSPFHPLNIQALKKESILKLSRASRPELYSKLLCQQRRNDRVINIAARLGKTMNSELVIPDWLISKNTKHLNETSF